jgi:aspartate ammonia-lyase
MTTGERAAAPRTLIKPTILDGCAARKAPAHPKRPSQFPDSVAFGVGLSSKRQRPGGAASLDVPSDGRPAWLRKGAFRMPSEATRIEHDLLGDKAVPADAYYGVQTARALENFHISGVELRLYPNLIKAFAMVKLAAARANVECGQFGKEILAGIEKACQEIIDGKLHDEFRLDVFQGGAGTSTNMNANEVIANRALELMGHKKGEYARYYSRDHINCSQSTNDAYPLELLREKKILREEQIAKVLDPAAMTGQGRPA